MNWVNTETNGKKTATFYQLPKQAILASRLLCINRDIVNRETNAVNENVAFKKSQSIAHQPVFLNLLVQNIIKDKRRKTICRGFPPPSREVIENVSVVLLLLGKLFQDLHKKVF